MPVTKTTENTLWGEDCAHRTDPVKGSGVGLTAGKLVRACAREAEHLARKAGTIDREMAAVVPILEPTSLAPVMKILQDIDLLRQELEGLSRVLGLVCTDEVGSLTFQRAVLDGVTKLASQSVRICTLEDEERLLAGAMAGGDGS